MNKYVTRPFLIIVSLFLIWRFFLPAVDIFATSNIPTRFADRFLGGGPKNYQLAPELFSWANFDGEHYLSISIFGYKGLEQAFFPIYPLLISFLSKPFSDDLFSSILSSTIVGLIISNISFLLSLIFLWELIRLDFSQKIAIWTLVLLVIFPTSFYFGALYNESLFLLLAVLTFYSARKGKWYLAGILGAIASATRVFGLILFPALLIEAWQQRVSFSKSRWLLMIPLGLLIYMLYQFLTVGDPLAFYKNQRLVGEQHQYGIILLPQVYFRYLKMLSTVDLKNPIYQTIVLELIVGIAFFLLPIYGIFKKIRYSYICFALLGFLLPTATGSFSSVPRYVIVFFPSFMALAFWVSSLPNLGKIILSIISISALFLESILFLRGYWVA